MGTQKGEETHDDCHFLLNSVVMNIVGYFDDRDRRGRNGRVGHV